MKAFTWLRARRSAVTSTAVVTASALAITTMAFVYQGFPTTEVDLNDGGVWLTKKQSLLVGHFNHESRVLDGGLRTTTDDYDILQAGPTVLVVDDAASTVATVDPAMVSMSESADIPTGAKTVLGATTVALLDQTTGDLWVVPSDAIGSFQVEGTDPLLELGEGADVTVGVDGVVYAVSRETAEIITIPLDEGGEPADPQRRGIEGVGKNSELTITAVGTTAVVLDAAASTLYSSTGLTQQVKGADSGVLQYPSAATESVALSSTSELIRVPLEGGDAVRVSSEGQGTPAAAVFLKGCVYSAWSGSLRFVRDCLGEADDLRVAVEGADAASELKFRVNRDVVVLNDIAGGAAWMASDSMQRVDNWNDLTPPEGDAEEDDQTTEETVETTLPERSEINTVPIAVDDDFGVRPGRTTVLPVLDNDTDADGDVLVASVPDGDPSLGAVQPIYNGAALQIAVPEDASGSSTFTYKIDDGRGGTDTASITLTVRDKDTNAPPVQNRVTVVTVEAGGVVSYNVLPDWIDPDGDDVFLKSVVPAEGDEADFTSDGRITYRALSTTQGRKDVEISVSDGTKDTIGIVRFDVRPLGSTDPVTNADHVVVRAGQTVTVAPLANDTSSGREPLRLARVDEVAGATIVPDFANKTFSFSSSAPQTYYVQYLASSGAKSVTGIVRVDVLPDSDAAAGPVAVRDVALLPSGGEVLVNVLANDTDPAGGILVVQSVTIEPNSGISVSVLGHETLRIGDQSALDRQVRVSYTISNGTQTAQGEVVVIPVPAPAQLRPPVANDDQVIVRAGDIVTIPVLENDYHPNGDTIHVAPDLVAPLVDPVDGELFISQDTLRFRAGTEPKTVYGTYEAVDSTGQKDAGYVTIQVLPRNDETNAAPRPRDLTARALSGSQVRIPIPLDGIDADGDSVELIGIATAPTKGRIVETGANFLLYEAFGDSNGVDAFTYRVRDRLGAEGTAPIRVGIAPAEAANQAPYAVKDSVIMRPSRSVAVPVLANDSDPEGDTISLVKNGLILPDVAGLKAKVEGSRIVVTSPDAPTETSLQYTIRDARGATSTAVLQVTVAEDVPLIRPIARDDRLRGEDVEDDLTATIEVLANDEDPDGTTSALTVTTDSPTARVLGDGRVRVSVTEEAQLITYTITDQDDMAASAFIFVPASGDLRPTLSSVDGIEVKSGETVEIALADHVTVAGGGTAIVTEAARVTAVHSNGAGLVKDQQTLVYTSADAYYGQDAITFEVTDGTGPDDPAGRKATLTLPVTVLPPDNQQPVFVNGAMDVAPGEDATSLDLAALTTDPDPDDAAKLQFSIIGGTPGGLSASVDGQSLNVSADANTAKGTVETLRVRIADGTTDPIEGTVTVRVTASTRPPATANDDIIAEAPQGKTVSVPVLENDFNPFPETPLKITTAVTETGQGGVEVNGSSVSVTPAETFFGTMVVRYRIQDATGDVDREVEGRIRLTVQGRPDAPGIPSVSSVQDRTVVLSWTPPANNGADITGYTVRSVAGGYTKQCASTTCTLDGLTNNVEYNFTVTATNRVNESDPSRPSDTARPDARPDTPQPPALAFGDRSLDVSWVTPTTPGSPVDSFTLEISPAPPSGISQKVKVTGNSLKWEGLENGVNYQVRVQAHNRAPDPSSWSVYSGGMIPAAPPAAPGAPTTARLAPVGAQAQMQVSWVAPANNGDSIAGYRLKVLQGGAVVNTISVPAGQTSQAVVVNASTTNYTFQVAATNKAGWGADSAPSAAQRAFTPPGAPTDVVASTPTNDSRIVVTYGAAAGNGATAGELRYEYSLNGGGSWNGNWDGRTITAGIANNNTYTVTVRAVSTVAGVTEAGPASNGSAATPYGPIGAPTASASASGTSIVYGWSAPGRNGRDITVDISIDGGGWQRVAASGSTTGNYGYSTDHSIDVRATDAAGQVTTKRATARTVDAPKARAWTVRGPDSGECSPDVCHYLYLSVENFPAGQYTVYCLEDGKRFAGGAPWTIPANGAASISSASWGYCYHGGFNNRYQLSMEIVGWNGTVEPTTWQ